MSSTKFRNFHAFLVIVLACAVVFGRTAWFSFVLDDITNLGNNPLMRDPTLRALGLFWTHTFSSLYIPVCYTAWWTIAAVSKALSLAGVPVCHSANIVLHGLNAWLVYTLLARITQSGRRAADPFALLGALLFLVHPLQVEAVSWVTGLKDVLSTTLALLALRAGFSSLLETEVTGPLTSPTISLGHPRRYLLGLALFVLALLTKPVLVVLPAILVVVQVFYLGRGWRGATIPLLPWFVVAGVFAILTAWFQAGDFEPSMRAAYWLRPFEALSNLWFYISKTLVPLRLSIDYGLSPQSQFLNPATWLQAGLGAMAIVLVTMNRRWAPRASGAGLIFALALLPVLGIFSSVNQDISDVFDRYAYFALFGASLVFLEGLRRILARHGARVALLAGSVIVALLTVTSAVRVQDWAAGAPCQSAVDLNAKASFALQCLGLAALDAGDFGSARDYLGRSYAADRRLATAINLAESEAALGNLKNVIQLSGDFLSHHDAENQLTLPARLTLAHALVLSGDVGSGLVELDRAAALLAKRGEQRELTYLLYSTDYEPVTERYARSHLALIQPRFLRQALEARPGEQHLRALLRKTSENNKP